MMSMKGILLTGGLGTRLYPLTNVVNKHLLPIYDRPMFYWPLQTLIASGISQIAVVSGPPTGNQVKEALKHFPKKDKLRFVFINQEKPLGLPHAIYKCKKFIGKDPVIMSVGDNLYSGDFKKEVQKFKVGAQAFIRKVKDPSRFGVVHYNGNSKIKGIVEKPKNPMSSWAIGAPYIFDNTVFAKIEKLKPSKRGELEIVDLLKLYLKEKSLVLSKRRGVWVDAGSADSLLQASLAARKIVLKNRV